MMSAWFSKKSEKEKIKKRQDMDDIEEYEDEDFQSVSPPPKPIFKKFKHDNIDYVVTSGDINGTRNVIIKSNDCSIKVSILAGKMEIDILDGNAEIKQPQKSTVDLERDLVRAEKTKGLGSGQNYW